MKIAKYLVGVGSVAVALAAHAAPFAEGFDNVAGLGAAGWVQVNLGAAPTIPWFQGDSGVFASHAGAADSYAGANFLSSATGPISNWLITPEITIGAGASLTFWSRADSPALFDDGLEVLFHAGAGTDILTFTSLSSTHGAAYPSAWTKFTLNLPIAATGRIAFRYFGDADTADYIGLDSVSVDAAPAIPEPSTYALMALGLAGLALVRRNRRAA